MQHLSPGWGVRPMVPADLPAVLDIQAQAYASAAFSPEQPSVYTERMALAPDLCLVAQAAQGAVLGYLVSHPWHGGMPPGLDMPLPQLPPASDCWYLHDCAVAAHAHGLGVAAALFDAGCQAALARGLRVAALVAVGDAAGYWLRRGYAVQHRPGLQAKLRPYGEGARYMVRALVPRRGPPAGSSLPAASRSRGC